MFSMATANRRIAKELQDIQADKDNSGIMVWPVSDNFFRLKGSFPAPPDTPYTGGIYHVDIQIPDSYPFKPPQIRFETKIWHPNISSQTGAICLDTLGTGWSPVQTIKTALISLRMLLESPNPKDPQDAEVASMMINEPQQFARRAAEWAVAHAGAPAGSGNFEKYDQAPVAASKLVDSRSYKGYNKDLIDRFVNMGFDLDKVVDAFIQVGIDRNGGEDYELEEAYMGDITAKLLGEQ